jgi:PAS domain S-box-containing protein
VTDTILNPKGSGSAALDDSERRLRAVLDNATVAIFLMDERQRCIYMNRAAEELTGYKLDEVLGLGRPLHDIIHHTRPDGRPFPLEECEIDRAFPEHYKVQGEEVFVHRDGSFYPVAFTASPVEDDDSKTVGTIIEVRNISEERLAAERQRLLMNELNHRVRNTLATIQAVARQSLRDVEPEAVTRLGGRISALAAAHDLLTDTTWHSADLRQIMEAAVAPFKSARFELIGPALMIDPKAAVSLSIALHELAANAARFGSLGEPEGRVRITWDVDDQEGFVLQWQEEGGPAIEATQTRGFGLRFIERQLPMEFAGSTSFEFNPSGFQCHMRLTLPPVSEPLDLPPPRLSTDTA